MEQKPDVTTYSTVTSRAAAAHPQPSLRRALGLWGAVSIVVGTVIGSGIFLVPTRMINLVGSVQTLFVVWIVAGVLSLFGALTYAELAAAMPEAGGEYVYLTEAYGPFWGFVYGWTQMWVAKSGSIATLAAGFYTYLTVFYPVLGKPVVVLPYHIGPDGSLLEIHYGQLVAIVLIIVLAGINYVGVEAGGAVQVAVTGLKMVLIGGVIVVGLFSGKGDFSHLAQSIPAGTVGVAGFLAGDGQRLVGLRRMEQRQHGFFGDQRAAAKSSEGADFRHHGGDRHLLADQCGVLLRVEPAAGVPKSAPGGGHDDDHLYGSAAGRAVTVAVLISILAALNGSILSGARVPYAMARGGLFFRSIAKVHPRFRTPGNSMIALCLWSCLVVLSGWFDQLYTFVIFGSWILYLMTAASVFVLRRKRPDLPRPYRVVGYPVVPILFVLVALLLLGQYSAEVSS